MKKVLFIALGITTLSACVQAPIYPPMTESEMVAATCRDLWKDSERLNREINNIRYKYQADVPTGRDAEVLDAAQTRLNQVRELSVQKMCTFG
ncbi:hypothetical protein HMPREF3144_08160 [Oligella sp. HMSC05A10]|uniref:hypothetical protein n=1 Tax=Oligella TaxID=90243 RepID=UPI0006608ED7|nr:MULTISPECIES: hypothetical protein [Oligella]OFS83785.1 hypothetical protein HMPREF3144_08160 [Oligella sp. HMSC05A10]